MPDHEENPGLRSPLNEAPRAAPRPAHRGLVRQTLERALYATPEQIDAFAWDNVDCDLAEAIVEGARTQPELATACGLSVETVKRRLRTPARCGWIGAQVLRVIPQRLGQLYAALYARALGGDVRAATMILERFDPAFKKNAGVVVNTSGPMQINLNRLTDEELRARIEENMGALEARGQLPKPEALKDES